MKQKLMTIFVMLIFVNLPLATALEIYQVTTQSITHNSATITWKTDEVADSFVRFNGELTGDANPVLNHEVTLRGLIPQTEYTFSVGSNELVDEGHSFMTLAPDTLAPSVTINFPEKVGSNSVDLSGESEIDARIKLFVNGVPTSNTVTDKDSKFSFENVLLNANSANIISIEVRDNADNLERVEGIIISDTVKPKIEFEEVPELVTEKSFELKGTISEESEYEILVGDKSVKKGNGLVIKETISLAEGENKVKVKLVDRAGLRNSKTISLDSDTKPAFVKAKLERGSQFYEGRAETTINGETKPGATVYLYIYNPVNYEFKPDFKKARSKVTAKEDGTFSFKDVDLESSIFDTSLDDLKPKVVPSGLLETSIFPTSKADADKRTSYIYIISEDRVGRTAFWENKAIINSCFSSNLDFSPESVLKFQQPGRLIPEQMDEGKQEIQAVFKFNYLGDGVPKVIDGREIEKAYIINKVDFQPACTKAMQKDTFFGLACKVLPRQHNIIPSGDGEHQYVSWKLRPTNELTDKEDDFWNDLVKRQLVFPLKIKIHYQERLGEGKLSPRKVQTSCYDLGYQVDTPAELENLIPDWLANEGIDSIDVTLKGIEEVRPKIETALYVSGVTYMGSTFAITIARWARIFTSTTESYFGWIKKGFDRDEEAGEEAGACPKNQKGLYMRATLENWLTLPDKDRPTFLHGLGLSDIDLIKNKNLEERCPATAAAWKVEAGLNQVNRWSGDRAFCRATPARWTQTKETGEIAAKILEQNQCVVTGSGVPLQKIENCQTLVQANNVNLPFQLTSTEKASINTCYRNDNQLYAVDPRKPDNKEQEKKEADEKRGFFRLIPIGPVLRTLSAAPDDLLVYKQPGSDTFIVAKDDTCKSICNAKKGFGPATDGGPSGFEGPQKPSACYQRKIIDGKEKWVNRFDEEINQKEINVAKEGKVESSIRKYPAGYTSDCFIQGVIYKEGYSVDERSDKNAEPVLQQCVCQSDPKNKEGSKGAREASPKPETSDGEEWFYRQDQVFRESKKTQGTYYPKERYYSARDLSGAFGLNHALDFVGEPDIPSIDPHSQYVGMLQTACFGSILKNMRMLESILQGARNCIEEAKFTGIQDAGMCKTIFTQHICGLAYRGMAYLVNDCHPSTFDDVGKDAGIIEDVSAVGGNFFNAMGESIDISIKGVQEDYGNAKLNEYFKGGAQGFAQSMCMAAMGGEFPVFSKDFIMDAAMATPMKTVATIFPANRELTTFNPERETAVYNYNIGGVIFPGCKIRQARVSLKCIGPEDLGNPNVDTSCKGAGCDCLNAQQPVAEAQRTRLLRTDLNLKSAEQFSIPLPPFEKISSDYRFDHVVLDLILDQSEQGNADKCFDNGYENGRFYFPIADVTPQQNLECSASLLTGAYKCPELFTLFGFGGAQMQSPFVSCFNKNINGYGTCEATNLFTIGDEIKTKVHLNLDGKGKCLKRTVFNVGEIPRETVITLQENLPGLMNVPDSLGNVEQSMFGGGSSNKLLYVEGNSGCKQPLYPNSPSSVSPGDYEFKYNLKSAGLVELILPIGAKPEGSYSTQGSLLSLGDQTTFTIEDINNVVFDIQGFKVSRVLGNSQLNSDKKFCKFRVVAGRQSAAAQNSRKFDVTYELFETNQAGTCSSISVPVKSGKHKTKYVAKINIQKETTQHREVGGLHSQFIDGNYGQVKQLANDVINREGNDLDHALALYYYVAANIMENPNNIPKDPIANLLKTFFSADYSEATKEITEFKKITAYMCTFNNKIVSELNVPTYGRCANIK
jgi:hypothetical protein